METKTVTVEVCGKKMEVEMREGGKFVKPDIIIQNVGRGSSLKPAHEPIACFSKGENEDLPDPPIGEDGSPFRYVPKAARKERNLGCDHLCWLDGKAISKEKYDELEKENEDRKEEDGFKAHKLSNGNIWPTVKPLALVRFLLRLVMPPNPEAIVVDPFVGSGTTAVAAILEGYRYIGIDTDPSAVRIAEARTAYYKEHREEILEAEAKEKEKKRLKAEKAKEKAKDEK